MAKKQAIPPLSARTTLSYDDAAVLTGLSKSTLLDAVLHKQIRSYKPGREPVLDREDIEKFIFSHPVMEAKPC